MLKHNMPIIYNFPEGFINLVPVEHFHTERKLRIFKGLFQVQKCGSVKLLLSFHDQVEIGVAGTSALIIR